MILPQDPIFCAPHAICGPVNGLRPILLFVVLPDVPLSCCLPLWPLLFLCSGGGWKEIPDPPCGSPMLPPRPILPLSCPTPQKSPETNSVIPSPLCRLTPKVAQSLCPSKGSLHWAPNLIDAAAPPPNALVKAIGEHKLLCVPMVPHFWVEEVGIPHIYGCISTSKDSGFPSQTSPPPIPLCTRTRSLPPAPEPGVACLPACLLTPAARNVVTVRGCPVPSHSPALPSPTLSHVSPYLHSPISGFASPRAAQLGRPARFPGSHFVFSATSTRACVCVYSSICMSGEVHESISVPRPLYFHSLPIIHKESAAVESL
eukprot:GGOE01048961.1.p1 GENE.GGOE01048961.1~~GGOE01048961.1.p1  ORF type:complete len:315 (-),score=-25.29 GGOE01048961.1:66-1010(-)